MIAKNGSGKTTLLKIVAGQIEADQGEVNHRKGLKISYLAQDPKLNSSLTIEECILQSDNEILSIIARYEAAMLKPENEEEYQAAFDAMEQHQAWDFETQYKQILFKLKIEQLHAKVSHLSGGQRKRVALCIALLKTQTF